MIGVLAALVASVFAASKDLCSKALSTRITPTLSAIYSFTFALPFYGVALAILVALDIPILDLGAAFYLYVLLRALSDIGTEWFRMLAMKHGDVSLVTGFISLSPLFLLISSPLITGDIPTLWGALGVVITTVGVFVLAGKTLHLAQARLGILFGIASAFFMSLNSCFDRLATLQAHPVVSGFWMTLAAGVLLFILSSSKARVTPSTGTPWKLLLTRGILEFLFMSTKLWALQYLQAPYVAALTKVALLITILGGGVVFGEKDLPRRIFGGVIIVAGGILVVLLG